MILLNTTFCISPAHDSMFLSWVKEVYLTEIAAKEYADAKILRLPSAESDSCGYAIQFCLPDKGSAERWTVETLPVLVGKAYVRPYGFPDESILHFSTVMEVVE